MTTASSLVLLTAETSIHAGAGQSVSGIDLPIQRESHTGWPCVYGSAVKGALRAKAETRQILSSQEIAMLFGPDVTAKSKDGDAHAGALMVGDARLLLLPVRSLNSHFKWVTCPALLERFSKDIRRLQVAIEIPALPAKMSESAALVTEAKEGGQLFLEEYRLTPQNDPLVSSWCAVLAKLTHSLSEDSLKGQLVIVHDDIFAYLSRFCTAVNPHIAIDSATKTVRAGALWYEESLPSETVMYVALASSASRRRNEIVSAQVCLDLVHTQLLGITTPYLQLGGNETTGMGWCRVHILASNEQ
ncbi:MAG: type III-B CRISPR module RAMP protein Cmr4 [Pseudomonadales bacterium]|nr:type III-B CRISPR module RAMP protein Cmr4 [Pseudomonadales bacterium]